MRLPLGKLPSSILRKIILDSIKVDNSVLLPPKIGEDGAVVRLKDNLIVAASDPITGTSSKIGWLSVHINANDIVVHAAIPQWFLVILLMPEGTKEKDIEDIMAGIHRGLEELRINLIGGHTEITNKVVAPIVAGFMLGEPIKPGYFIQTGGAKPDDAIIITKGAGIEGTLILATDFYDELKKHIEKELLQNAQQLDRLISVYKDVMTLISGIGLENIHSMHDATEGGLLGALYELSEASNTGFVIYEEKVPILKETKAITEFYKLDPLKLISSGTLVATIEKNLAEIAVKKLQEIGINAEIIGRITEAPDKIVVRKNGYREILSEVPIDELWKFLGHKEV
ncbi:MAG: AIR synthase family protein [Candidatus Njordarchaeia archaeon]|nr:AIR synthase family protein [Candidatus Korarchaeota archaeon]